MSCKEKSCTFVSTCPVMMSSHIKLFHKAEEGKTTEETEHKVEEKAEDDLVKPQEPIVKLVKSIPVNCQEDEGKKLISGSGEKKRKVEDNVENENRNTRQSPKKRPRNIRINVCDILKKFKKFPVSDQYLIDLTLRMMHSHSKHTWSQVKNNIDGEIDERESVIKTLIEDHLSGCEHCRNTVRADPELNWNLDSRIKTNPDSQTLVGGTKQGLEFEVRALKELSNKLQKKNRELYYNLSKLLAVGPLKDIPKPALNSQNSYSMAKGYKLIDTNQMGLALKLAQECGHGTLILVENLSLCVKVDLATQMGFVCTTCGAQTMFTTSKFSTEKPNNFSINKHLMGKLGKAAYYKLAEELRTEDSKRVPIKFKRKQGTLMPKPKMILGYDFVQPKDIVTSLTQPTQSTFEIRPQTSYTPDLQQPKIFSAESNKSKLKGQIEPEKDVDPLELTEENNVPSDSPEVADTAFDPCQYDPVDPASPPLQPLHNGDNFEAESIVDPGELDCNEIQEEQKTALSPTKEGVIQDCESITEHDFDQLLDQDRPALPEPEPDNIEPETNDRPANDDQQSNDSIDDLLKDDPPMDKQDETFTPKNNPGLKIRAFKDLQQDKMDVEPSQPDVSPAHSWTIAEGAPPEDPKPLTCSDIAPNTLIKGGFVTPVRPGVKIVSSNVIRSTTTESQLPKGVYRFRPHKGNEAILVVNIDKQEATKKTKVFTAPTSKKSSNSSEVVISAMKLYIDEMMLKVGSLNEDIKGVMSKRFKKQWLALTEGEKMHYRLKAAKNYSAKIKEPKGISLSTIKERREKSGVLPKGWKRNVSTVRGYKIVTVSSPDGRAFTDKKELKKYVEDNLIDLDLDLIDFSPHVSFLPWFSMPISDSTRIQLNNKKKIKIKDKFFVNLDLQTHDGFSYPHGVWVPITYHQSQYKVQIPLGYRSDEFDPVPPQNLNKDQIKQRFLLDPEGKKQSMQVQIIVQDDGEKIFEIPLGYKLLGEPKNDFVAGGPWCPLKEDEVKPTPPTKDVPSTPDPAPSSPIPPQLPIADDVNLFADYDEEVIINDGHL